MPDETNTTLSGLWPGATCQVSARAETAAGKGEWSPSPLVFTTPLEPPRVAPVTADVFSNASACAFRWLPVSLADSFGEEALYNVYSINTSAASADTQRLQLLASGIPAPLDVNVTVVAAVGDTLQGAPAIAIDFVLAGLQANSTYAVAAAAVTSSGEGPQSAVLQCTTTPSAPPPVDPPAVTIHCDNKATVSWVVPQQLPFDASDLSLAVQWAPMPSSSVSTSGSSSSGGDVGGDGDGEVTVNVAAADNALFDAFPNHNAPATPGQRNVTAADLQPGTVYAFRVVASANAGSTAGLPTFVLMPAYGMQSPCDKAVCNKCFKRACCSVKVLMCEHMHKLAAIACYFCRWPLLGSQSYTLSHSLTHTHTSKHTVSI